MSPDEATVIAVSNALKRLNREKEEIKSRLIAIEQALVGLDLLPRYSLDDLDEVMRYDPQGDFVCYDNLKHAIDSAIKRPAEEKG